MGVGNKAVLCQTYNSNYTELVTFDDGTGSIWKTSENTTCIEHSYVTPGEKTIYQYRQNHNDFESLSVTIYIADTISDVVIGQGNDEFVFVLDATGSLHVNVTFLGSDVNISLSDNATGEILMTETPIVSGEGLTLNPALFSGQIGQYATNVILENRINTDRSLVIVEVEEPIAVEIILPKGQTFTDDVYVSIDELIKFTFTTGSNVLFAWMIDTSSIILEQCTGKMDSEYESSVFFNTTGIYEVTLIVSNSLNTVVFNATVNVLYMLNNIEKTPYTHPALNAFIAIGVQTGTETLVPMGDIDAYFGGDFLSPTTVEKIDFPISRTTDPQIVPCVKNYTLTLTSPIDTMYFYFEIFTEPDLESIDLNISYPEEVLLADNLLPITFGVTMDSSWSFTLVCSFSFPDASFEFGTVIASAFTTTDLLYVSKGVGDIHGVANCSNQGLTSRKIMDITFYMDSNCFDSADIFDSIHRVENNPITALVTANTEVCEQCCEYDPFFICLRGL